MSEEILNLVAKGMKAFPNMNELEDSHEGLYHTWRNSAHEMYSALSEIRKLVEVKPK